MASSALTLGSEWLRPTFEAAGLPKLADHWHLVILSTLACVVVDKVSAMVYFLWDLAISLRHIRQTGPGFVLHALVACLVFLFSYRPFLNAYGPIFLMFELSTPFLNIHWFMDKLGLTGSVFQMVNGVLLLGAFFLSRLVFGIYWAGYLYLDVYHNWHRVPTYLTLMYVIGNVSLNLLNMYWFTKMVTAVQSRFTPTAKKVA
ncbi:hypothetical protein IWQ61_008306 [Dispira simplex]|nr:hypothetical protein IWQ61_008306 [Dispira simplex]